MKKLLWAGVFFLMAGTAASAGDPGAGEQKSAVCAACHGESGKSGVAMYPNLCGQHAAYLESALKAYRSKERAGGNAAVMYGMTSGLSDEDIANLAAYYSEQSCE